MSHGSRQPRQTWAPILDGSQELVELVPYSGRLWGTPDSFRVRLIEENLRQPEGTPRLQRHKTPAVGIVDVDGHRLTMTCTNVALSVRSGIRRNVSGLKRSGPLGFFGNLLGGAGLGGGMAAAAQTTLAWLIYELSVDGEPSGAWVAKTIDGMAERWIWVPPGSPLPDNQTMDF
jgi:hypothetical protein